MSLDILSVWLVNLFFETFAIIAGLLFCFGFSLVFIESASLSSLFRRKDKTHVSQH